MGREIGAAAGAAGLLVAEPDDADRAARAARLHHLLRRRGDDGDARRIVDRAGAEVPAVEVAADEDHARRRIGAGHVGDDVAGRRVADEARREGEVHDDVRRALQHALEVLGVGKGRAPAAIGVTPPQLVMPVWPLR